VPAGDRKRLEHLCRYILRPPVAQEALELTPQGKILLRLRRPWSDGTRAISFEPSELLEKLASMTPKPRTNLLIYHGVFAPNAARRRHAVQRAQAGEPVPAATVDPATGVTPCLPREDGSPPVSPASDGVAANAAPRSPPGYRRPTYFSWADLLRRTFEIDVLACPDCGGKLRQRLLTAK